MLTHDNCCFRRVLVVAASVVFLTIFSLSGVEAGPAGFDFVTENDYLELYLKESTTEIAVLVKETGDIWHSNPQDLQTMETRARGTARDRLNSQLSIGYYIGNQLINLNSYTDSIAHNQYEIIPIENGIRVEYIFGEEWSDQDFLPLVISEESFNELLASIEDESDREFVRDQYAGFTFEEGYEDPDAIAVLGVDFDTLLGEHGINVYEPGMRVNDKRRLIQEYLREVQNYQGYNSLGNIKTEDVEAAFNTPTLMRRWNIMVWDMDDLISIIKSSGFSPEVLIDEHLKYNVTPPSMNMATFDLAIEYVIDGEELVVKVPSDSITYPHDIVDPVTGRDVFYPLSTINVLPYFGAANSEETGYLFVPDGSGALINMNSGKTAQPYRQNVYGRDHSTTPVREYSYNMESQVHLPVFGSKFQDRAFLAIIESGDTAARINAEIAGYTDSYNKVYSNFSYIPSARVFMQSGGAVIYMRDLSIMMYQSRPNLDDIVIRYSFLGEDEADYTGMALRYQEYLVDRYQLTRIEESKNIPFLLELIGGIEKTEPVFGVSQKIVKPVTTFKQVDKVVDYFSDLGINKLSVRYSGWLKGGLEHTFASKVNLESKLGTEKDFQELVDSLHAKEVDFYPNVNFLHVYKTFLFDGYSQSNDAARALDRRPAYINRYNIATHLRSRGNEITLLSLGELPRILDTFIDDYTKFGATGLSFDKLGNDLYADYQLKVNELVDREQAKNIVVDELNKLNQDLLLMVSGGNAYTFPHVDFIVDAPSYSRNFPILDQGVPFYQIALRGYIPYAGEPGNLTQRPQSYLLKLLETGAAPYYMLSYADSVEFKASQFDNLYSVNYLDHSDEIVELYAEVNSVLQSLWHERIVDHEKLGVNIYRTTYEDGTSIIVNYNSNSVEVLDLEIPEHGYRILRGEDQLGQE